MAASPVPYLFLAALPVAGYVAYRAWQQEQKRRALLIQWAGNSGFQYAPRDDQWC